MAALTLSGGVSYDEPTTGGLTAGIPSLDDILSSLFPSEGGYSYGTGGGSYPTASGGTEGGSSPGLQLASLSSTGGGSSFIPAQAAPMSYPPALSDISIAPYSGSGTSSAGSTFDTGGLMPSPVTLTPQGYQMSPIGGAPAAGGQLIGNPAAAAQALMPQTPFAGRGAPTDAMMAQALQSMAAAMPRMQGGLPPNAMAQAPMQRSPYAPVSDAGGVQRALQKRIPRMAPATRAKMEVPPPPPDVTTPYSDDEISEAGRLSKGDRQRVQQKVNEFRAEISKAYEDIDEAAVIDKGKVNLARLRLQERQAGLSERSANIVRVLGDPETRLAQINKIATRLSRLGDDADTQERINQQIEYMHRYPMSRRAQVYRMHYQQSKKDAMGDAVKQYNEASDLQMAALKAEATAIQAEAKRLDAYEKALDARVAKEKAAVLNPARYDLNAAIQAAQLSGTAEGRMLTQNWHAELMDTRNYWNQQHQELAQASLIMRQQQYDFMDTFRMMFQAPAMAALTQSREAGLPYIPEMREADIALKRAMAGTGGLIGGNNGGVTPPPGYAPAGTPAGGGLTAASAVKTLEALGLTQEEARAVLSKAKQRGKL